MTSRFSACGAAVLAAFLLTAGAPLAWAQTTQEQVPGTSTLTLQWTAPGDDGAFGVASRYDLRYSPDPITPENFDRAEQVTNLPKPSQPGRKEKVKVRGLTPDTHYYFALKTADEAGNWSGISNVTSQSAPRPTGTDASGRVSMAAPFPNPALSGTLVRLSLPREAFVELNVFDAAGRVAKTLASGTYPAGDTDFRWDLRDRWGNRLGSGVYWIRGIVEGLPVIRAITILN